MGSVALVKSIVQHRHCVVCRKVCPPDKDTCSEECEKEWKATVSKKKLYYYILWAAVAVMVALLIVVQLKLG